MSLTCASSAQQGTQLAAPALVQTSKRPACTATALTLFLGTSLRHHDTLGGLGGGGGRCPRPRIARALLP